MQNIETDVADAEPGAVTQQDIERIVAEYTDSNLDALQGPPGPRGATGGLSPQGPQGEEGPAGADGVAEPRGATGAQGPPDDTAPPESDGGFPWLPLQIAAGVLLAVSLAFGAWSYLRRR